MQDIALFPLVSALRADRPKSQHRLPAHTLLLVLVVVVRRTKKVRLDRFTVRVFLGRLHQVQLSGSGIDRIASIDPPTEVDVAAALAAERERTIYTRQTRYRLASGALEGVQSVVNVVG